MDSVQLQPEMDSGQLQQELQPEMDSRQKRWIPSKMELLRLCFEARENV